MPLDDRGHDQSVLPSRCPHPKCQERYGKKEVQVSTLGNSLLDAATQKIQKQVIDEFKRKLTTAETNAKSNQRDIESLERYIKSYQESVRTLKAKQPELDTNVEAAKAALAAIEAAFGAADQPTGPFKQYVGNRFHLDSKSGGKGHFMKVDANGNLTCSCEGFMFGKKCWATLTIAANLRRGDQSYYYYGNEKNFDARVRPASTYFRVPGYGSRKYDRYARLG